MEIEANGKLDAVITATRRVYRIWKIELKELL